MTFFARPLPPRGSFAIKSCSPRPSNEAPPAARADEGTEFLEAKVRRVLVEHCYRCHSHDAKKVRGGLLLDTRDGLRKGGDTGPAVVPGHPARSLLILAVRHAGEDLRMPPDKKLPDAVIADLEKWIAMGAPDPRDGKAVKGIDFAAARRHWAYQPIREPKVPAVRNAGWAASPIDHF